MAINAEMGMLGNERVRNYCLRSVEMNCRRFHFDVCLGYQSMCFIDGYLCENDDLPSIRNLGAEENLCLFALAPIFFCWKQRSANNRIEEINYKVEEYVTIENINETQSLVCTEHVVKWSDMPFSWIHRLTLEYYGRGVRVRGIGMQQKLIKLAYELIIRSKFDAELVIPKPITMAAVAVMVSSMELLPSHQAIDYRVGSAFMNESQLALKCGNKLQKLLRIIRPKASLLGAILRKFCCTNLSEQQEDAKSIFPVDGVDVSCMSLGWVEALEGAP